MQNTNTVNRLIIKIIIEDLRIKPLDIDCDVVGSE